MSRKRKHTIWEDEEKVRQAFRGAECGVDVFKSLGLNPTSTNYRNLKNYARRYSLEVPKAPPHRHTRTAVKLSTTPLEEILVKNSTYKDRQRLKRRLIREKVGSRY